MGRFILVFAMVFSSVFVAVGQATKSDDAPLDTGNIQQQYDYIMRKSNTYEGFKVIKISRFEKFKNNIQDSIKTAYEKRDAFISQVSNQENQINSLTANVNDLNGKLETAIKEKDGLKFLGVLLQKGTYKAMMWGIVAVLLFFAVFAYLLFKRSNKVTKTTKKELEEVKEEFETHRKRALKREQELAVKYHAELNKLKQRMS